MISVQVRFASSKGSASRVAEVHFNVTVIVKLYSESDGSLS
jgi:hypothetical protein